MTCTGMSYAAVLRFCCCRMLRILGVRSDDVCLTAVASGVLMLSWFDILLLCTSHTHIHRDYWHKGESLEHGCRCIGTANLLRIDLVAARLSGCFCKQTKTGLFLVVLSAYNSAHFTYRSTHTYTQRSTVRGCH